MRMWFTSLVALALVVAASGGPVAGQEPKAAAHRPPRIRVVAWRTTDGNRNKVPVAGATVVVRPRDGVVDLAAGRTGADGVVLLEAPRQPGRRDDFRQDSAWPIADRRLDWPLRLP